MLPSINIYGYKKRASNFSKKKFLTQLCSFKPFKKKGEKKKRRTSESEWALDGPNRNLKVAMKPLKTT